MLQISEAPLLLILVSNSGVRPGTVAAVTLSGQLGDAKVSGMNLPVAELRTIENAIVEPGKSRLLTILNVKAVPGANMGIIACGTQVQVSLQITSTDFLGAKQVDTLPVNCEDHKNFLVQFGLPT